jgi:predicted RNase H-like HicB family nuclease
VIQRLLYEQAKLIPLSFQQQILSRTVEYTLNYLIDHEFDFSVFAASYHDDETGTPAYDPAILLKIILYAYSRGIVAVTLRGLGAETGVVDCVEQSSPKRLGMNFTIEYDREENGRWLAEVPQLPGVLAYGASAEEAMTRAEVLALRVLAAARTRGELSAAHHHFHCSMSQWPSRPSCSDSASQYRLASEGSVSPDLTGLSLVKAGLILYWRFTTGAK